MLHSVDSTGPLARLVGERVRNERQSRQWTLDRLAEASDVSRRMLINIEHGAANPSIGTLLKLSDALGVGLVRLGDRAAAGLATWARPLMEELARELGESVNLASLEGDRVVYVAHVPSARSMRMFTEVGSRVAAHSTGVGKAMLAQMPPEQVEGLVARTGLPAVSERTITDPVEREEKLKEIQRYIITEVSAPLSLYVYDGQTMLSSDVQGYHPHPDYSSREYMNIWLVDGGE